MSQEIEIEEALRAVDGAQQHLEAAARQFKSAGNWGLFDMFGGGGFATLIKHGKLEAAQFELEQAQRALTRLSDELRDVEGFAGIGVDMDGFMSFADFLFDNAFVDMLVQQKIGEARRRVADAIAQCEDVRSRLQSLQRPNRSGDDGGLPGAVE